MFYKVLLICSTITTPVTFIFYHDIYISLRDIYLPSRYFFPTARGRSPIFCDINNLYDRSYVTWFYLSCGKTPVLLSPFSNQTYLSTGNPPHPPFTWCPGSHLLQGNSKIFLCWCRWVTKTTPTPVIHCWWFVLVPPAIRPYTQHDRIWQYRTITT